MTYPKTIKEVEALESKLQKRNIDLNNYWHLTTQMKIVISEQDDDAKADVAKLMRELKSMSKTLYVKPVGKYCAKGTLLKKTTDVFSQKMTKRRLHII